MSNTNLINVNDEISPQQAHARTEKERKALDPSKVRRSRLDHASVNALILGLLPRIKELRPQMAKLPGLDLHAIDELELRLAALTHAQMLYLIGSNSPDALRELSEEARLTIAILYADAQALVRRGLISAASLDDYTGGTGYKIEATDLQLLVTVLKGNWSTIQGKCAVELAELERAEKVASRILRLVGTRLQAESADDPLLNERDRAYTLVENSFDEYCRAATWLRWPYGDVEQYAPSLYTTRKARQQEKEPEQPQTPAAPAQPNAGTTPNTNLNNLPGGSPFID